MIKVLTYGTFDLLHHGHIRLLERAKALGDYLVVGVTSDDFDKARGKINVQESLTERIAAVRECGLADEIIVEEYEGQKIDDIIRYDIDVFTVGSDWQGCFDYLKEFCEVIYLPRTEGISSTEIRSEESKIRFGIIGDSVNMIEKFVNECDYVNGIEFVGICCTQQNEGIERVCSNRGILLTKDINIILDNVDAVYIVTEPRMRDRYIKYALEKKVHVLCEAPITLSLNECEFLFKLSEEKKCVLMNSIKTAYALAFDRLLLLIKTGIIGNVISIDATCTSIYDMLEFEKLRNKPWGSLYDWGAIAMLPIFSVLGIDYLDNRIYSRMRDEVDEFTKIEFRYKTAVATIKVGNAVKSEGDLVISGTKGYIYVPSPWWKTDYFEVRFEKTENNKRFFYHLEGEGIRYMLVNFVKAISGKKYKNSIDVKTSSTICKIMEDFTKGKDVIKI